MRNAILELMEMIVQIYVGIVLMYHVIMWMVSAQKGVWQDGKQQKNVIYHAKMEHLDLVASMSAVETV